MKRKKMRERGKINILKDKKNEFSGSYTTPSMKGSAQVVHSKHYVIKQNV